MNKYDRGAEKVDIIIIRSYPQLETVPSTACVCPVGDSHYTLVAEAQLLSASNQLHAPRVEVQITLSQIEGIAHV
jgi:hypothetical protein